MGHQGQHQFLFPAPDLPALSESESHKLHRLFETMDEDKSGKVNLRYPPCLSQELEWPDPLIRKPKKLVLI